MEDLGWRQRMAFQHLVEACPLERILAIAPRQPFLPYPHDLIGKPAQSSTITANAIVGEVAPHHRRKVVVLVADRVVPVCPAPVAYRSQPTSKAAFGRHLQHHVFSTGPTRGS